MMMMLEELKYFLRHHCSMIEVVIHVDMEMNDYSLLLMNKILMRKEKDFVEDAMIVFIYLRHDCTSVALSTDQKKFLRK